MTRIVTKPFNGSVNPVGKSQRCIFRRPSVFRIKIGVLFLFAFAAALAFFTASLAGSAQQPAGAASQSQPGSAVASGAAVSPTAPLSVPGLKLSDFAWLEGRWRGDWGPRVAEQVWMAPKAGMMPGDFRLVENDKDLVIEFFTLVEKNSGIN